MNATAPEPAAPEAGTPEAGTPDHDTATAAHPQKRRWRRRAGALCLVVSCLLAPLAVVTTWAKNEVLSTDRYVSTVAPLASNRALTDYVATRVTEKLSSAVEVDQIVKDALPPRAAFLATPIATGVETAISEAARRVLSSEQFSKIWVAANRAAHEQVRQALTGDRSNVKLENGRVVLDLSALMQTVRANLSERGLAIFDKLPTADTQIKIDLFDAKGLESARRALRLLVIVRVVLVVSSFLFLALGIYLSQDRRRSLARWGFGLALTLGLVGVAITFGRGYVLDHLESGGIPKPATAALIDATTHYLRLGLRAGMVLGLLTAAVAALAGPGRAATRVRATASAVFRRAPAPALGPVPAWVAAHHNVLIGAGLIVALLAIVAGLTPGPVTMLIAGVILLTWVVAVELLTRAGSARAGAHG